MKKPSLFFQLFHNPNDPRFKDKTWQERQYAQDDLNGMMPFDDEETLLYDDDPFDDTYNEDPFDNPDNFISLESLGLEVIYDWGEDD